MSKLGRELESIELVRSLSLSASILLYISLGRMKGIVGNSFSFAVVGAVVAGSGITSGAGEPRLALCFRGG